MKLECMSNVLRMTQHRAELERWLSVSPIPFSPPVGSFMVEMLKSPTYWLFVKLCFLAMSPSSQILLSLVQLSHDLY